MSDDGSCCDEHEHKRCCRRHGRHGGGQALYCLGVLGAAVYYIQASTGFWSGALGLIKAFFWPAFVVHKVFLMLAL